MSLEKRVAAVSSAASGNSVQRASSLDLCSCDNPSAVAERLHWWSFCARAFSSFSRWPRSLGRPPNLSAKALMSSMSLEKRVAAESSAALHLSHNSATRAFCSDEKPSLRKRLSLCHKAPSFGARVPRRDGKRQDPSSGIRNAKASIAFTSRRTRSSSFTFFAASRWIDFSSATCFTFVLVLFGVGRAPPPRSEHGEHSYSRQAPGQRQHGSHTAPEDSSTWMISSSFFFGGLPALPRVHGMRSCRSAHERLASGLLGLGVCFGYRTKPYSNTTRTGCASPWRNTSPSHIAEPLLQRSTCNSTGCFVSIAMVRFRNPTVASPASSTWARCPPVITSRTGRSSSNSGSRSLHKTFEGIRAGTISSKQRKKTQRGFICTGMLSTRILLL